MDSKIALIPALAVHAIILSWVNKLEKKCDCSADWRRDYIKYFSIVSVVIAFANAFMPRPLLMQNMPLLMIFALAGLVNMGAILSYIPNLKKKQCDCAIENDWRDNFIFWWIIVGFIMSFAAGFMSAYK